MTTCSIANDVAKYFAIIPAMFARTFPVLDSINVMRLDTPRSAILSAVIFDARIIVAEPARPPRSALQGAVGGGRPAAQPLIYG